MYPQYTVISHSVGSYPAVISVLYFFYPWSQHIPSTFTPLFLFPVKSHSASSCLKAPSLTVPLA